MFTGIVEEVGSIRELRFHAGGAAVAVAAKAILPGVAVGDSVAVNGVCLTATRILADAFVCDISEETLRRSAFRQVKPGARVNLERALPAGGRLGGHIMQGHVDDVGRMLVRTPSGGGFEISFGFPRALARYLVRKGSVAVNGISLTIATLGEDAFSVAVIPHTLSVTNLGELRPGDPVNLEVDVLGRYFERYLQLGLLDAPLRAQDGGGGASSKLTVDYLKGQGF
ncbi:MAG: riboflavin synthase [Acidobacteriota bacterium]|nr:riboflavin synthase [Acidobacteriota bacterium]